MSFKFNPITGTLDLVDKASSGGITGTLTTNRVPFASGTTTVTDSADLTFTTTTGLIGNDSGGNAVDFRWETDTKANAVWVDASSNTVNLGYSSAPTPNSSYSVWSSNGFAVASDPQAIGIGVLTENALILSRLDEDATYGVTGCNAFEYNSLSNYSLDVYSGFRYTGVNGTMYIYDGDYINFSTTTGSSGYGIRNNLGVPESKNSGGSWIQIAPDNTAYSSSWDGDTKSPSKNAVYDEMQLRKKGGCETLGSNFTTTSTTRVSTNLSFAIGANEIYKVRVTGTASKGTSNTGLKVAIDAPTGCTIKGVQYGGGATLAAALVPSLITAINTLGTTFATGIGIEVGFVLEFVVRNSTTPGNITLQCATVTSNTATIFANTTMEWELCTSV